MRCLILPLILCAFAASAQDKLVTFDVAITDSHGRPITDVNADELQLQDNGKHFRIAVFHLNDHKPDKAAPGANQYSNSALPAPSATALVLDYVNQTLAEQGAVRARLTGALEHLNPAGYLLLATITDRGPAWIEDFPNGPSPRPDNGWTARVGALLENTPNARAINAADRAEFTAQSLDKIAQSLARFPGQKKVVWIAEGTPREQPGLGYSPQIAQGIAYGIRDARDRSFHRERTGVDRGGDWRTGVSRPGHRRRDRCGDVAGRNLHHRLLPAGLGCEKA